MTTPQILAFAIIGAMMALFVWGRLRYDLVARAGAVRRDRRRHRALRQGVLRLLRRHRDHRRIGAPGQRGGAALRHRGDAAAADCAVSDATTAQVAVLAGSVALLSAFVKNIGALAMLMPVAFQLARKNNTPVSYLLMPMAFAALLGGIVTLVGTSPNIIVARMREELLGTPFSMFDFTPVGAGLAIGGVIFLAFGWRLLPGDARARRPWTRPSTSKATPPKSRFRKARRSSARPSARSRSCRKARSRCSRSCARATASTNRRRTPSCAPTTC